MVVVTGLLMDVDLLELMETLSSVIATILPTLVFLWYVNVHQVLWHLVLIKTHWAIHFRCWACRTVEGGPCTLGANFTCAKKSQAETDFIFIAYLGILKTETQLCENYNYAVYHASFMWTILYMLYITGVPMTHYTYLFIQWNTYKLM